MLALALLSLLLGVEAGDGTLSRGGVVDGG